MVSEFLTKSLNWKDALTVHIMLKINQRASSNTYSTGNNTRQHRFLCLSNSWHQMSETMYQHLDSSTPRMQPGYLRHVRMNT